ncbi:MAG TPA: PKD domain-containing protein [Mycobacteriales bacterium]|nr:PKD domain-containing protein [Mycobacteriales bacterium]
MRIRPIVTTGVAAGVAAALAVATSATALAATDSHHSTHKHPVAALHLSTAKPAVGSKVVADVVGSRLPKGDRLRKATIRFGDKTKAITLHGLKAHPSHKYAKAGSYTVVLTIVDKHGVKVSKSKHVTVHAVPGAPKPAAALPVHVPAGLSPTTLISALGLPVTTLTRVATIVGIPAGTLSSLPVGFLRMLPASDLTGSPLPSLPGLAGLPGAGDLVSLLTGALGGLPFTLPTNAGLTGTQLIGTVPSTVLSTLQLTSLSTLFGIPTSTLATLPLGVLGLLPGNLVQYVTGGTTPPGGGTTPPPVSVLPLTIPSGLLPTSLVSSLGLSSTALSTVSSLVGIPTGTLSGLPVGFLSLLPAGDLTGAGLPSLPGLASLPLVGNLLGMLLAGLPITIPAGTSPTTLISALPTGVLSSLQLTTLSTYFGIAGSVLGTLPVNVLTLLPSGMLNGL